MFFLVAAIFASSTNDLKIRHSKLLEANRALRQALKEIQVGRPSPFVVQCVQNCAGLEKEAYYACEDACYGGSDNIYEQALGKKGKRERRRRRRRRKEDPSSESEETFDSHDHDQDGVVDHDSADHDECADIPIMDMEMTCGELEAMLGSLCDYDYGAPGAVCECMCKREPVMCCRAYSLECMSCAASMSEEDYCLANPDSDLCPDKAEEDGHCVGEIESMNAQCVGLGKADCEAQGVSIFSDGVCDWITSDEPTPELPNCVCPSFETGAVTGTEMCEFGSTDCALASGFPDGCPSNAVHCALAVEGAVGDPCAGLDCNACLTYVPADNESWCGFSDAGCELASKMSMSATGTVWDPSQC